MGDLHAIRIECPRGMPVLARVFIDGQEVKGCLSASFRIGGREPAVVILSLYADVEIEGEADIVHDWRMAQVEENFR